MSSSFTISKSLEKPANGDDVDTWDVPVNGNSDAIDACFGATTTLNAVSLSGVQALTLTQYRPPFVVVTGTLTANVNYQLPTGVGGEWSVLNITTGAFTVTWSSAGGGVSVVLPQGSRTYVQSDGTNVITGAAASGANSDIKSLSGLTTPLSVGQGGTGVAAAGGTVYATLGDVQTFTGTKGFLGTASSLAAVLANAAEAATLTAAGASGTIPLYLSTQSVLFYTQAATGNWTVNLTMASANTLNSAMAVGEAVTCVLMATQGSTAFYNNVVQVDGATSGVTTKWLGGAPAFGQPNGVDFYTYVIIKTANATFSVFTSLASFF